MVRRTVLLRRFEIHALLFLLASGVLYFIFQYQGKAVDVFTDDQKAYVAMNRDGGVITYQIRKTEESSTIIPITVETKEKNKKELEKYVADKNVGKKLTKYHMKSTPLITKNLIDVPKDKVSFSEPGKFTRVFAIHERIYAVNPLSGVYVLGVVDNQLEKLGWVELAGANSIVVQDGLAYVTAGKAGLYVLKVSDPSHIIPLAHYDSPGVASDVVVHKITPEETTLQRENNAIVPEESTLPDIRIYLADGNAGLRILNLSIKISPGLDNVYGLIDLKTVSQVDTAYRLHSANGLLFIAARRGGLCTADIRSLKDEARFLECNNQVKDAYSVAVRSNRIFVADGFQGLAVLSGGDTGTGIQLLTLINTQGSAQGVAISKDQLYLADGKIGLILFDIAQSENPIEKHILATPGEPDIQQLFLALFDARYGNDKIKATWNNLQIKLLISLSIILILSIFFSQFVLPVTSLRDRVQIIFHFLLFMFRRHEGVIYVENGRVLNPPETYDHHRRGAWVVCLNKASAAMIADDTGTIRSVGPGVQLLRRNAKLAAAVDLRIQPLVCGPELNEDPFRERSYDEADGVYVDRQRRRMETSATTRDNLEVVATLHLQMQVGADSLSLLDSSYLTMIGEVPKVSQTSEDGSHSHSALYKEIIPFIYPAQRWQRVAIEVTARVWKEQISRFTLEELFTEARLKNRQDVGRLIPTSLELAVSQLNRLLTQPEVQEINQDGESAGPLRPSHPYEQLRAFGIRLLAVDVLQFKMDPQDEERLLSEWREGLMQKGLRQKLLVQQLITEEENEAVLDAQREWLNSITHPFIERVKAYGSLARNQIQVKEAVSLLHLGMNSVPELSKDDHERLAEISRRLGLVN